jgi:hypothetical protein
MDLYIGMRRARAEQLFKELGDALAKDATNFEVELYAKNERGEDVNINLSNDDMEREDARVEDIYVEYSA